MEKSSVSNHRRKPNREWGKAHSGIAQEQPKRWIFWEVSPSFRRGGWVKADNGAAVLHSRNLEPGASTKPNRLQNECGYACGVAPLLASRAGTWMWSSYLEAPCNHGCASVSRAWSLLEQEYLHLVQLRPLTRHLVVSLFAGGNTCGYVF